VATTKCIGYSLTAVSSTISTR